MEDLKNKKTLFVIFSKDTGNIIGNFEDKVLVDKINKKLFDVKEVELGPNEYYLGGFEDGKIFNKLEKPFVNERDIIDKTYEEVLADWPLFTQISVILDVLDKNKNIEKTEDFNNLINYLKQTKNCLKIKIDAVKNNKAFNFVSAEDLVKAYGKEKLDT